jgi:hypothetical protein
MTKLDQLPSLQEAIDRNMAEKKLRLEKKYGAPLGESLFHYAYGNLPYPELEMSNAEYGKKRETDKNAFVTGCAILLESQDINERKKAVDAMLTANEILTERMIENGEIYQHRLPRRS